MSELNTSSASTEQWRDLVREAAQVNGAVLDDELESYLVFLLMRYMQETSLSNRVMALDYLNGMQCMGSERNERMRDVGDRCLLFSGLYPKRAKRRHVKISYYVNLGRSAYANLSGYTQASIAHLYSHLSESFVALMDTLLAIRSMQDPSLQIELIDAYELWQETNSQQARRVVMSSNKSFLVNSSNKMHKH